MAELLEYETWMQKVPRQMQQVGRSNLILTTKQFHTKCVKIIKKQKTKKKQFSSPGNKFHSSGLFLLILKGLTPTVFKGNLISIIVPALRLLDFLPQTATSSAFL